MFLTLHQHVIDPKFVNNDVGHRADPLFDVGVFAPLSDVGLK